MADPHDELIGLLRHREAVIADHAWRDRDPDRHLDALAQVSGKIDVWHREHASAADPKLNHFLTNASYAKALAHLTQATERSA